MEPVRDVVLIKADSVKDRTDSGLYINEGWKSLPLEGEVLAVGPLVSTIKTGDRVGFARYASIILPNDQRLCNERHILWVAS